MLDHDLILTISTLFAVIPAVGFLLHYSFRVRWWETETGKAIFGLLVVAVLGLGIRPVSRLFPGFFLGTDAGFWIRVILSLLVGAVLANLWRVLVHAQREGRRARRRQK